jgi:hypothetical protein
MRVLRVYGFLFFMWDDKQRLVIILLERVLNAARFNELLLCLRDRIFFFFFGILLADTLFDIVLLELFLPPQWVVG